VPRRDWVIGGVVVVALLAVLAGTVVWRVSSDDRSRFTAFVDPADITTPTTEGDQPEVWPIEIQPLAEFVEQHRGGPFDHPVPIEYLEEDEYEAAITDATLEDSEEERVELEEWAAQMRSLGLLPADVDLEAVLDQLYGEGTLAFYDDEAEVIKVLGANFDVAHRVTLVHELTHVWQDQHGYIPDFEAMDDTEASTLHGLLEGDATRIENLYVDTLSERERDQYSDQSQDQAEAVDLSGVPGVLVSALQSAYVLGEPFVSVLDDEGGNAEVDVALADPPPADADLLEPTRYLDGVRPVVVAEPALPEGAERIDGGDFGALSWLMVLGERIDPRAALTVADNWAGDQYLAYRRDGRVCTAVAFRPESPAGTGAASDLMGAWAAASTGLDATVETVGDDVVLRSCEPAAGSTAVPPVDRTDLTLGYAALRTSSMAEAVSVGATVEQAACFGDFIVQHLTPEQMEAGAAYDPATAEQLGADAVDACT
jgi:hypothetical protein